MSAPAFAERKVVLVRRTTRLDELIARFNSAAQARFYVEHQGADFGDYEREHADYHAALAAARAALAPLTRLQELDRAFLPNYLFSPDDVVVAVGQDGLVANTLKYLDGQPLIGVNPAPRRWDGVLLPFTADALATVVPEVLRGKRQAKMVTLAEAQLNNGQSLLAVNDLFIGQRTHVSARYELRQGKKHEWQSSSGIIVSTGLGATGWLKGVFAGAAGVVQGASGKNVQLAPKKQFAWDADYLCYAVREPFPTQITGTSMVYGTVRRNAPLVVVSHMAENGVIFSDGVEKDFLEFNSGTSATVTLARRRGQLVV